MIATIYSVVFSGLQPIEIEVQTHISGGKPEVVIVGLADKAVAESKERIRSALSSMGMSIPVKKVTINLAPANIAKEGSHFDLPIALSLLIAMEVLSADSVGRVLALGELSLDGRICAVEGVLSAALYASEKEIPIICPQINGSEATLAGERVKILAPSTLLEITNHYMGRGSVPKPKKKIFAEAMSRHKYFDFADIAGQFAAKRAIIIAACGGHNVLMCGHPGVGKSMLASAIMTIMPPLLAEEAMENSIINSLAGLLADGELTNARPYRAPHHSASTAAIIGGGKRAKPGEITLANNGVLFLDELPEFNRSTLDALRQPLESMKVTIARAESHIEYPAKFQLIAAMNPCKCGYFADPARQCRKVPNCALDYKSKISGPMMDRIDIHIEMTSEAIQLESVQVGNKSSKEILPIVAKIHKIQLERYKKIGLKYNAHLSGNNLQEFCPVNSAEAKNVLQKYIDKHNISMRSYAKVLRIARTIADLAEEKSIEKNHILEAIGYRF